MVRRAAALVWLGCGLTLGCSQKNNLISSLPAVEPGANQDAQAAADASLPDADAPDAVSPEASLPDAGGLRPLCVGNVVCACSNDKDDDGDNLADGLDGECTGPYDNDEGSFATGEVKEHSPKCLECYFRAKRGAGNDSCRIASSCGIDGTSSISGGNCPGCTAPLSCEDSCLPRTPNGCDCFGCCDVQHRGQTIAIRLDDSCKLSLLDDVMACPRCQIRKDCFNGCDPCELCPGKTLADLPDSCAGSLTCSDGRVCGGPSDCGQGEYCLHGCCLDYLL
jgi:hypothetical protein